MTFRSLFIILISLLYLSPTNSKSLNPGKSNGHEADIYSALPFRRCTEISDLILVIHKNIDSPNAYFKGLRDAPHQDFTWHKHGHRVFFHWGFNSNPRNCDILQELVSERKWSKEVETSFWNKVIKEQARRNKDSMTKVSKTLGFELSGTQRAYANAFASIITDIHILGDYSTTRIATLKNIDLVIADIKKALFGSLKGGDLAKNINKKLDSTSKIKDVRERANSILIILHEHLPTFFIKAQNGYFARHFEKLNLPLKSL